VLIVRIHNDGTGDKRIANYDWDVSITASPTELVALQRGRIEGHDRTQDWSVLVGKVVAARYPERQSAVSEE
jgi:hypothetical protein